MSGQGDHTAVRRPGTLYAALGRLSALLTLLIVLVLGPIRMIELNQAWGWPRWQVPAGRAIGAGLMVGAVVVWLYCSRLFSRIGKGTPFVTEPPRHLVTAGLYRYSRNPIYVAHVALLFGWVLRAGDLTLVLYAGLVIALLQAVLVWWEEPGLRERFGEDYVRYTQSVPRWLLVLPGGRL
jgi:protein-S-isoprenylcysteine O-methyltransferase Ste14